ncbi:gliding motility protein GldF [Thermogutta terrifontis]|uniref:Gliding motility protein GldF n=1 Tax=Thermogutta terrifontis TaxID=1331910 RepID=A0A286RF16_9BACT|nr:Gldg family protein [Thermogutta terrifontis]ASV74548.1 gliding motility protein GldF [Thermogutta terrifontis]
MNTKVLLAVAKRNFISYFASPIAYLFICVFVALSTVAAFWPNEFFDANLANLDQLNKWFPYVMLVFIPAITMGIWADERRQGTDELLLTMPATDWEVVLGKFFAAVAIFTVSLVFSFICNYAVLRSLGNPDFGLFVATYLGYWLMGLAMLGIGMVASFFTANLTVAYILGVLLNAPAVFLSSADVIMRQDLAIRAKAWSIAEQFANFGRGLITLSGLAYFVFIAAVTLYVAMVLIGRRHWPTGESRLPSGLFFAVLHLAWLGSFALLGSILASKLGGSTLWIIGLVIGYLILHAALLYIWQQFPRKETITPIHFVAPGAQVVTIIAGAVVAILWGEKLSSGWVFWTLMAILIALHVLFFVGWATFPRAVALMPAHFTLRTLALAAASLGLVAVLQAADVRVDITNERISSLSPHTLQILRSLDPKHVVQIEAFISPEVPESYIQTRANLINLLKEFEARAKNVRVRINNTELFTAEAQRAAERFNITPQRVFALQQGRWTEHRIFMGVAFICGLERVVVPFIDRDIPVEYELIRSIATVTQQKRKRVGILTTDAQLFGQFSFQGGEERWPIVDELQKQYEVVRVEPADLVTNDEECEKAGMKVLGLADASESKIIERGRELLGLNVPTDKLTDQQKEQCKAKVKEEAMKLGRWDVLLAVQPSTLAPEDMDRFIAAISYGQPTVVFEDPMPLFASNVAGTGQERRPPQQMMMFGMRPLPKGDITKLWRKLGIDFTANEIVWQRYNPYPKFQLFEENPEFVFVNWSCGAEEPFNRQIPAVGGLQQVLFPFPGAITRLNSSTMKFTPLVRTGRVTGLINYDDIFRMDFLTGTRELNRNREFRPTRTEYILAAAIEGKLPEMKITKTESSSNSDQNSEKVEEIPNKQHDFKVVLVSDIDMLHETFFRLRQRQDLPGLDVKLSFDNVTMVLNLIDWVAGDDRFIDIRNRRPKHRTLTTIERATEAARARAAEERQKLQEAYNKIEREEREKLEQSIKKLEEDMKKQNISLDEILRRVAIAQQQGERRLNARMEEERQKRDRALERIETELSLYVRRLQNFYKMVSVIIPPLFPLGLAVIVFIWRRAKEMEGIPDIRRVRRSSTTQTASSAVVTSSEKG